MPDRVVRFTEQFFDRLGTLLPEERGAEGRPSITDFLLLGLPAIRDRLATAYERVTMTTADPDVCVYVGVGILIARVAVFVALDVTGSVEAFWIEFDEPS